MKLKGQSSMMVILIVIMVVLGLAVFLLSVAESVSNPEYISMYTHNMLLSVLRSDTGYSGSDCRLVSDLLACSLVTPYVVCGNQGKTCLELANETVAGYMSKFEAVKDYDYLFTVRSENFITQSETGEPIKIFIGNSRLEEKRTEKITANERIFRKSSTGEMLIKVQLIIAKK